MLSKLFYPMAAIAAMAIITACGDDVTEVTEVNETVGMQVVEKGESMPKCGPSNVGAMVYSLDSAKAYYCADKKWKVLSAENGNGKDGKDGANGKDGNDGKDGKDGNDGNDGESCTALILADSSGYKIVCGGDSMGVILDGGFGNKKDYIVDARDQRIYRTVTIGKQTWMAENLNYDTTGACYGNDPINCNTYGRLYRWEVANVACPEGWHLPSKEDFETLNETVGTKRLKASTGWTDESLLKDVESSGFAALPGGYANDLGVYPTIFSNVGIKTRFWTTTKSQNDHEIAYYQYVELNSDNVVTVDETLSAAGLSVRCIKD